MLFLIVDDDALSRDLLTLLLEAEGYEVEAAASGEAAVARAKSCATGSLRSPQVILTDIQMPGLAGGALASALRAALDGQAILLAMSGSQPPPSALTSFDGFLLKPFQISQLQSLVERRSPSSQVVEPAPEIVPARIRRPKKSSSAVLDEGIYAKMCDLMPVEQLGQMYALCLDDARKRIAQMQALAAAGDDSEYRKEAHAVKGGSGMIGASELYTLAAAAEQKGLPPHSAGFGTTSVTATLAQLSLACDRLERILQERTRK